MRDEIKLSIIVPVYNCQAFISECLDSLVVQDLSIDEYEILVIDDASTDNTANIVNTYAKKHKNPARP